MFIPHSSGSLEEGFPPKASGLLPYLFSSPRRSHLFGESGRGIQHAQLSFLHALSSWEQPSHRGRTSASASAERLCPEGRLWFNDYFSIRKPACGQIEATLSTILHAMNTSFLPVCLTSLFVQNTGGEGRVTVASPQS